MGEQLRAEWTGGCLCGAVRFEIRGRLRDIIACHCRECRIVSGHFTAATATRPENLSFTEDRGLRWFESSEIADRGFCHLCGSTLFWRPRSGDRISIYAGSLDGPTGLRMAAHIFVGEKGDYYCVHRDEGVDVYDRGGAKATVE